MAERLNKVEKHVGRLQNSTKENILYTLTSDNRKSQSAPGSKAVSKQQERTLEVYTDQAKEAMIMMTSSERLLAQLEQSTILIEQNYSKNRDRSFETLAPRKAGNDTAEKTPVDTIDELEYDLSVLFAFGGDVKNRLRLVYKALNELDGVVNNKTRGGKDIKASDPELAPSNKTGPSQLLLIHSTPPSTWTALKATPKVIEANKATVGSQLLTVPQHSSTVRNLLTQSIAPPTRPSLTEIVVKTSPKPDTTQLPLQTTIKADQPLPSPTPRSDAIPQKLLQDTLTLPPNRNAAQSLSSSKPQQEKHATTSQPVNIENNESSKEAEPIRMGKGVQEAQGVRPLRPVRKVDQLQPVYPLGAVD